MRKLYTRRAEQYRMIMECRQSGLSDCQWCKLKGIHPGTFYNWVTRLGRTGLYGIPDKTNASDYVPTPHQDIVEIVLAELSERCEHFTPIPQTVMELSVVNLSLKIPNDTNQEFFSSLLEQLEVSYDRGHYQNGQNIHRMWPRTKEEVKPIAWQQFDWLMSGFELEQPKAFKPISECGKLIENVS